MSYDVNQTRNEDGSLKPPGPISYPVDVFDGSGSKPTRRVRIVRETREGAGGQRILFDAAGNRYTPRRTGLGVEEVG